jgi:hypothetical protein
MTSNGDVKRCSADVIDAAVMILSRINHVINTDHIAHESSPGTGNIRRNGIGTEHDSCIVSSMLATTAVSASADIGDGGAENETRDGIVDDPTDDGAGDDDADDEADEAGDEDATGNMIGNSRRYMSKFNCVLTQNTIMVS